MSSFRSLVWLVFVLLVGCDQQAVFDKFVPKDESEFAKAFVTLLISRDFASVEQRLDTSLQGPQTRAALEQVAAMFPPEAPTEIQVVGANTVASAQGTKYEFTLQYIYPKKWLLASVVLQRKDGHLSVTGIHVNPIDSSLQQLNGFTFEGKGAVHYIFFALAIVVPLFTVSVLLLCIRTPIARRKWLWVVFVLFGFIQFSLNWTDGEVHVSLLSFLLLGAGFLKAGPAAPYVLSFALPLGAILFLVRRRRLRSQSVG